MARPDPDPATWWTRYQHRFPRGAGFAGSGGAAAVPAWQAVSQSVGHSATRRTYTAADLTEDTILRRRADRPRGGWRRMVYAASGGLVNPGMGAAEFARLELRHRIRRPLSGAHQVTIGSIKGGVGKTTVTACLGLVLSDNRGDRVVALDANPDAGTLADRLTGESDMTVRQLLDDLDEIRSWGELARYMSLAGRLQVLASEQDPAMSEAFSRAEYERVCGLLRNYYNVILTDSGTGLVHSAMEGALALADSLIIVGSPTVDGASRASKTLDWLVAHGHSRLVADALVVLSCDRASKEVDASRVRSHFASRCRAVVEIPYDPHLATGGRVDLRALRGRTLDGFLELAALVADRFAYGSGPDGPSADATGPDGPGVFPAGPAGAVVVGSAAQVAADPADGRPAEPDTDPRIRLPGGAAAIHQPAATGDGGAEVAPGAAGPVDRDDPDDARGGDGPTDRDGPAGPSVPAPGAGGPAVPGVLPAPPSPDPARPHPAPAEHGADDEYLEFGEIDESGEFVTGATGAPVAPAVPAPARPPRRPEGFADPTFDPPPPPEPDRPL